jgi:ATP-dependent Clp protease ATP-binding subunit ClpC
LGQGVAVSVLKKLGLDLENTRAEIEKLTPAGPPILKMTGNIPYTPRIKNVLKSANKDANTLEHTYVGTEHILLGLLSEREGIAAKVFDNAKIETKQLRNEILKELDPNFGAK